MTSRTVILIVYLVSLLPFGNAGNMVFCRVPESRDIHVEIQHHACAKSGSEDAHPSHAPSDDAGIGAVGPMCVDIPLERFALIRPDERSVIISALHDSASYWNQRVGTNTRPLFGFMYAEMSGECSFPLLLVHTTVLII